MGGRVGDKWGIPFPPTMASVLRMCLLHLKAPFFFGNCVFDLCNFQGLQLMLCAHLSTLTATCQDAGYAVKPWRKPQFCRKLSPEAGEGRQDPFPQTRARAFALVQDIPAAAPVDHARPQSRLWPGYGPASLS